MHPFQFPSLRLVESPTPLAFAAAAQSWLTQREAENHLLLATLTRLAEEYQRTGRTSARFFTLQDGKAVLAALIALPDLLHITWASLEMMPPVVSGLAAAKYSPHAVTGPGHVAFFLASAWAQNTGTDCALDRSDRVYQLARVTHTPPPEGRIATATTHDLPIVLDWFAALACDSAATNLTASLVQQLVGNGQIFLWHQPGPVAMATVADPTPSGVCIRHAYVPASLRRQGHGKAILAALGNHVLASGRRFCFLMADPADLAADTLLQKIGARTICEYARWRLTPPCKPAPAAAPE